MLQHTGPPSPPPDRCREGASVSGLTCGPVPSTWPSLDLRGLAKAKKQICPPQVWPPMDHTQSHTKVNTNMTYRQATFYAIYLTCSHLKSSPDMRLSCRVNLFSNSRLSSKPFLFDFLTNTLSSDTQDGCVLSALLLLRFPSVIVFFMSVHCLSLCVADSWSEPVVSFCVLHVSHCGMGV